MIKLCRPCNYPCSDLTSIRYLWLLYEYFSIFQQILDHQTSPANVVGMNFVNLIESCDLVLILHTPVSFQTTKKLQHAIHFCSDWFWFFYYWQSDNSDEWVFINRWSYFHSNVLVYIWQLITIGKHEREKEKTKKQCSPQIAYCLYFVCYLTKYRWSVVIFLERLICNLRCVNSVSWRT